MQDLNSFFAASGFQHQPNQNEHIWSNYVRPISATWLVCAHGDWRKDRIDVGLKPANELGRSIVGTVHRFHNQAALERDLGSTLLHLEGLAAQPNYLKCPECQTRWVHVKEGAHHRPFLSCDGIPSICFATTPPS